MVEEVLPRHYHFHELEVLLLLVWILEQVQLTVYRFFGKVVQVGGGTAEYRWRRLRGGGGIVLLAADNLTGNGRISAQGGVGGNASVGEGEAGGGGGAIIIPYAYSTYSGLFAVAGGNPGTSTAGVPSAGLVVIEYLYQLDSKKVILES